ncbi:MAG: hypothetical protein C4B56_00545 [Candidatus Methanophagaceae archaeon]|nr:MAG: hypothetical protein C4B56_00545 [Methanophagales archaeon]
MAKRLGLKVLAISIALVIVASSVAMYGYSGTEGGEGISESGGGKGVISLVAPPFIGVAGAGEAMGGNGGGAFPKDKAGISAYINTSQTIDIEKIKTIFTEVEEVGDNYIIGITPISDFGGDIDVHVYADTDGWIVAYLETDEPAAKIMQWGTADVNNPTIGVIKSTTLEDALYKAGDAAGVGIVASKIKYYDFEFPNADSMTLFVRTRATAGTNIAQVEIPADYMLFEASYYHYVTGYYRYSYSTNSKLKVDGATISSLSISGYGGRKWGRAFDSYKGAITTGTLHKIEIAYGSDYSGSAGVATVLIYRTG